MPSEIQKKNQNWFFNSQPDHAVAPATLDKKPVFVDVGGNGDCGFRAVAAGIIDHFLMHPRLMNNDFLKKILDLHFGYFPEHRTTMPGLVTAAERMLQLTKQLRMNTLIQTLSYSLRQMAVNELCAHPDVYRGAFIHQNEHTTPEQMRKASTWIDESSIAALANALAMPIEVHVVERVKTLPMRLVYNATAKGAPPVVIQLQSGHYVPRVTLGERFTSVLSQPVRGLLPVMDHVKQDQGMADIFAIIALEDERLLKTFETTYKKLSTMVAAHEFGKNDLLDAYVTGISCSDYLEGRTTCVSIEQGSQHFFDTISRAKAGFANATNPADDHEKAITNELIHALARAVSIGQMSEDHIFGRIEQSQNTAHRSTL